ncbi:MAG: YajQ family cyclic di-GMP-binding protein [Bacteroidota bacterium]|nr:YajQ family cyclic di-GMP-binding protein [Bacteroidota bacterium]
MASFDIVNKVDLQNLDNAINASKKELLNRYDFRGSQTTIDLNKKDMNIHVLTEDGMKLKAITDVIITRMHKAGLHSQNLDLGKEEYASGNMVKKDMKVKQGIDKDTARKIVKAIKDLKIKVEPAIMDEQVRVSGKKLDDLQSVMLSLRNNDFGIPLQFINMK